MGLIRLLLALSVAVTHTSDVSVFGITMMNGVTAVQCFYVISGYLITMILNERPEYHSIGKFYLSRYLRLWPTYILIWSLVFFFSQWPNFLGRLPQLVDWPARIFIVFSNLTMFFQDWFLFLKYCDRSLCFAPAFEHLSEPIPYAFSLVPQAWTLGIEISFYAIAPFICRRWYGAAALLLFGLGARIIVGWCVPYMTAWSYRFAPSEMLLFGAGSLAYFVGAFAYPRIPRTMYVTGLAAIVLFTCLSFCNDGALAPFFTNLSGGGSNAYLKLTNYPVLLLMACTVPAMFYTTRNSRLDRLAGEMSYPIYISHTAVATAVKTLAPAGLLAGNALYIACVLVFSLLLVFLLVIPIDRLRHRGLVMRCRSPCVRG